MYPQHFATHASCQAAPAASQSQRLYVPLNAYHSAGDFGIVTHVVPFGDRLERSKRRARALCNTDRRSRCRRASKSWHHLDLSSLCLPVHGNKKKLLLSSRSRLSRSIPANTSNRTNRGQAFAPDPHLPLDGEGARC